MFLPLEHCMLDNSPNALPNMLADLFLYQPQEIKVFSVDMGISRQIWILINEFEVLKTVHYNELMNSRWILDKVFLFSKNERIVCM